MTRALTLMLIAALSASCSSGADEPRFSAKDDHFSLVVPAGFTPRRELGSLVFSTGGPTTIAVRSLPVGDRTPAGVIAATEKVLRALPGAKVSAARKLDRPGFTAVAFDLTYTPDPRDGLPYERRHAVLLGKGRLLHVLHTGPAGSLEETAKLFEKVLASIREDV